MSADLAGMSDEGLHALIRDAEAALEARAKVAAAEKAVRDAVAAYAAAAGVSVDEAWRALAPAGTAPAPVPVDAPDWVQPQAHNTYKTGDRVRFEGRVYESTRDGNAWSPISYPQGWSRIG